MKNIFIYAALSFSLFASCQNNTGVSNKKQSSDTENDSDQGTTKNISKRDYSINKSNSYSDLFLDSATMERFIAQKKLPDTLARRIRSFYNARNYQYAWFTSGGLTEQARGVWNLYSEDSAHADKKLKQRKESARQLDASQIMADILAAGALECCNFVVFLREGPDSFHRRQYSLYPAGKGAEMLLHTFEAAMYFFLQK